MTQDPKPHHAAIDIFVKGRKIDMSSPPTSSSAAPQDLLAAGLVASQANQAEEALQLFAQASEAASGWAVPHFLMGAEHAALGDVDKAERAMSIAVVLDPSLRIARYQLGLLQYSSGRAAPALVTWQPLLAQEDSGQGLSHFVRGFAALAQDQIDDAHRHFAAGLASPCVDAAVAGDVQKVLAGLRTGQPADTAGSSAEHLPSSSHVLVSMYDKYKLR